MKKVLLITVVFVSLAFSYNALLGTRGTYDVYSAKCENMGMLNVISPRTYFLMDNILGSSVTGFGPSATISFTPWHYLEFSVWGNGAIAMVDALPSTAFADVNVGGIVKGGVPIYLGAKKRSFIAPGIMGFTYYKLNMMDVDLSGWAVPVSGADITALGFGGLGLLTFDLNAWLRLHLNGGYRYLSVQSGDLSLTSAAGMDVMNNYLTTKPYTLDVATLNYNMEPSAILMATAIEIWPLNFAGVILEGVAAVPQSQISHFLNYTYVTGGLRFGFGGERTDINIDLGVKLDLPNVSGDPIRWAALGGIGLGFDLMPDKAKHIEGLVVDKITGDPVAAAKVYIQNYPEIDIQVTGTDGKFSINIPEAGYTLVAEHPHYVTCFTESDLIEAEGGVVMLELAPASAEAVVVGTVTDAVTGDPIGWASINFIRIDPKKEFDPVYTDATTGYYRAQIPGGTYRLAVEASGYAKTHKTMRVENADELIVDFKLEPEYYVHPVEPDKEPYVEDFSIYFGRGESWVSVDSNQKLEQMTKMLKANPYLQIEIQGHTDSVGDAESNYHLSVRRAENIQDYFVKNGISIDRVRVLGFGEFQPKGDNRTRSGRSENRRVDVILL